MSDRPEDIKREQTKARLRAFLRSGESEDVASVLVHTLMAEADRQADEKPEKSPQKPAKKPKK